MSNEMIPANQAMELFSKTLESMGDAYTSIDISKPENKIRLYNAINGGSQKVSSIINQEILMTDGVTVPTQVVDDKTGEARYIVRSIIIDDKGNAYSCSSTGMHMSLRNILAIFGTLHFEEGLRVKVKQTETKRGRTFNLELI